MNGGDLAPDVLPSPPGLPPAELYETSRAAAAMPARDWPEPEPEDQAAAAAAWAAGIEASAARLGMTRAEYLNLVYPVPDRRATATTWRTLADVSDAPPRDLILGMFEDGPNLAYALGGTGKGTTGAWACGELITIGMKPMIYDPENRPKEWARRVSGLGIDRSRVVYIQPKDLPRNLLGRPLWDVAPYLGQVIRGSGSDFLFVDSVLPAVGIGEERLRSDAQAPYLYVAALDALVVPSLSFGHPPKGQPEGDPFGSVSWTNAMRLTWLGTPAEGEGHWIRWRPRKRNERGHIAGVLLHVLYGPDGRPCQVIREDDEASTREWILAELGTDPRSAADLAAERADEDMDRDSAPTKEEAERAVSRMRQTLLRMSRDGLVAKDGKGRNTKWFRPDSSRLKLATKW
jgi:hypothetical protein